MFGYFENKVSELYKVLAPEPTEEEKFLSAIVDGDLATVQQYIEGRGFDPNLRNSNGNTPLHVAAFNGQAHIVDYLLEKGSDPMALGQRNNTCLHYAAVKGNLDLVKKFIELGNSPIAKNENGKTPYDVASGFGLQQYLMPLMFSEERRTGTAPRIAGATVDMSQERERLANLAPPPKMGESAGMPPSSTSFQGQPGSMYPPTPNMGGPPVQQQQQQQQQPPNMQQQQAPPPISSTPPIPPMSSTPPPAAPTPPPASQTPPPQAPQGGQGYSYMGNRRPNSAPRFQPDGFGTTVGNPELAAQYGNKSSYRPADTRAAASNGPAYSSPPTLNTNRNRNQPRYVTYDAMNNAAGAPVQYQPRPTPNAPIPTPNPASNVKVFNPTGFSSQQQPMMQQQQPMMQQQQQPNQFNEMPPMPQQQQQQQFQTTPSLDESEEGSFN